MAITKTLNGVFKLPRNPPAFKAPTEPAGMAPHVEWTSVLDTHLWADINDPENPANKNRKQGVFHPSEGLHPDSDLCERSVMFDLLCAERSASKIPAKLAKILDNGTYGHKRIQAWFHRMKERRHLGIVDFVDEAHAVHPTLPLEGHADGIVTMERGWRYLLDFKTRGVSTFSKTYEPDPKHVLQLTSYMGMLGVKTGYMIYENRDSLAWAEPSSKFRINFDPKVYAETEAYCTDILHRLAAKEIPTFDEGCCSANDTFCKYRTVCSQERQGLAFDDIDRRDPETLRRQLKVVA